jgi:hypothetical protein
MNIILIQQTQSSVLKQDNPVVFEYATEAKEDSNFKNTAKPSYGYGVWEEGPHRNIKHPGGTTQITSSALSNLLISTFSSKKIQIKKKTQPQQNHQVKYVNCKI